MSHRDFTCVTAYDLRGRLGIDLDADVLWRMGRAFAALRGGRVVVGRDSRASSPALADALMRGLTEGGAEVLDLGLAGTEEMYHATGALGADGGMTVTASHNPIDYNGLKLVGAGAAPLDPEADFAPLLAMAQSGRFPDAARAGRIVPAQPGARAAYVAAVADFVDATALPPLRVLTNPGHGTAGPTLDALAAELAARGAPLEVVRHHHAVDPSFPQGIPNPLLPENHALTGDAVRAAGADLGVAWDGDFDRCFLFDATGRFVPGEIVVGLLAEAFLARHPGARVVHDPRVVLATRETVAAGGGEAVVSRTGHAFVKAAMRASGAVYGGEMSAHHYFRDFYAADSGMIPWLLVVELMGRRAMSLAGLVDARRSAFPSSGEINFRVPDPQAAINRVLARFGAEATARDDLDGVSLEFPRWRLNLRRSNTEPLLRLNVETRGDPALLAARVAEVTALIEAR